MYRSRLAFSLAMATLAAILACSPRFVRVTFQRTYGGPRGDCGNSVLQTADEGYAVAGFTESFGLSQEDFYLVRVDKNGDTVWTRTYGGINCDRAQSVQLTADGGLIVGGYSPACDADGSDMQVYLVRTDVNGESLWTRTLGATSWDYGYSVLQTADGGYAIAGHTGVFGNGHADVRLVKTNARGDTLWTRAFGGPYDDCGYSAQQTADSGYIITGLTVSSSEARPDVYLIRTNVNGDTLWTRAYGGAFSDRGNSVRQTSDGGCIVAGEASSFGAGMQVWLIKTDVNGDTLWTRTFGGDSSDRAYSVVQTTDGGYIIAGSTTSFGAGSKDVYLIKTDASGDTLWTRTFGGSGHDYGYSVQQTADGGYIIAGSTTSLGAGSRDVYLIKTDSLGNVTTPVSMKH